MDRISISLGIPTIPVKRPLQQVKRQRTRWHSRTRKLSLHWLLIIPFILQVITVVALVGYLSYRNGQRSVEDLTNQLTDRVSKQVQEELDNYLEAPLLANQINQDTFRLGTFDLQLDRPNPQFDRYLIQQMQRFPSLSWISFGAEANNNAIGIWRPSENEPLQISMSNRSTDYFGTYYTLDRYGNRSKPIKIERPAFYPRTRPWYKAAIEAKGRTWTPIYAGFTPGTVFIAASEPIYNPSGQLIGVSGIDLSLNGIQKFLAQNPVSPTGHIFLMERSGLLIASSGTEEPFQHIEGKPPVRVNALHSQTPLIQGTATAIQREIRDLGQIKSPKTFYFTHSANGKPYSEFVQVLPFSKDRGLDWLIVIVVPEEDVMGPIHAGTLTTGLLCLSAVIAVIFLNILLSRRLVYPLRSLSDASQQIAQGNFNYQLHDSRILELSTLSSSFTQMSQEVLQSREDLEEYSRSLEQKVIDRTQALQAEMQRRGEAEAELQAATQELRRLAYIDALTQLANRRQFDERLLQDWRQLTRYRVPLSLILCDIDQFKRYNETYGRESGNDCLCAIAKTIAHTVRRPYDLVARYSAEEFVILLPNTPLTGAIGIAKLLQTRIRELQIPNENSEVAPYVTLSFGVASIIPTTATTPEMFLTRADCELYRAKHQGYDRISSTVWG
jgi:diguanylate cyclase (GGDEF)-like protein